MLQVDIMPGWIAFIPILLVYGSVVLTWFLKKFLRANPEAQVQSEEQVRQQQTVDDEHKEKTE